MTRIIYKFKNKERLNEAVGYLAAKQADIKMHDVPSVNEFKLEIECRAEQVEEIRSNIKSLNESYKLTETTSKIIKMLSETAKGTGRTIRLMDGDVIRLTPEHANVVILTHDELSEENQVALRTMVIESRKTHEAAIQFCLGKLKETE